MRVTRLKRGYAISLTDSEWDVLASLVALGDRSNQTDYSDWSPAMKAAYTRCINKRGQFLGIDRDRRKDDHAERAALEVAVDDIDRDMNP